MNKIKPALKRKKSLVDIQQQYSDYLAQSKKPSTVRNHCLRLASFMEMLAIKKQANILAIDLDFIELYQDFILKKSFSTHTQYFYLQSLQYFLTWLFKAKILPQDFAKWIQLPKWLVSKRILTRAEISLGLKKLDLSDPILARNAAIISLHLIQNIAVFDLEHLTTSDYTTGSKVLKLPTDQKYKSLNPICMSYLNNYLVLRTLLNPRSWTLFLLACGRKVTSKALQKVIREFINEQ